MRFDDLPHDRDAFVERRLSAASTRPVPLDIGTGRRGETFFVDRPEPRALLDAEPLGAFLPDATDVALQPERLSRPLPRVRRGDQYLDPLYVFGADDRLVYNDTRYPWGLVCKVWTPWSGGSGVIVGPRHVLTASHCVDWDNVDMTVDVHLAGRSARASTIVVAAGAATKLVDVHESELDEDYAVLITERRIGDEFGWFGVRNYDSKWDEESFWWNIGYPDDTAGGVFPVFQKWKWLDEDSLDYGWGRAANTDADLNHGQSGSPMFGFWGEQWDPYVVAVVSSESDGDNYCSTGSMLPYLVGQARSTYP